MVSEGKLAKKKKLNRTSEATKKRMKKKEQISNVDKVRKIKLMKKKQLFKSILMESTQNPAHDEKNTPDKTIPHDNDSSQDETLSPNSQNTPCEEILKTPPTAILHGSDSSHDDALSSNLENLPEEILKTPPKTSQHDSDLYNNENHDTSSLTIPSDSDESLLSESSFNDENPVTSTQTIEPHSDGSNSEKSAQLFSSQSPIKHMSPQKPPAKRRIESSSESDEGPLDTTPHKKLLKRMPIKPLHTEKNSAKETVENMLEELDAMIASTPEFSNPPSDPLMTQAEQDMRDLLLLDAIERMYGYVTEHDIDWTRISVYNMEPHEIKTRFHFLLESIPRLKSVSTLVSESRLAFCRAKVRTIPKTVQDKGSKNRETLSKPEHKKLNAYSLFMSNYDLTTMSRGAIKDHWERLNTKDKMKLRREARLLNKAHGYGDVAKHKRKTNQYAEFTKEQLSKCVQMKDIGQMWRAMSEVQKAPYRDRAVSINLKRTESKLEMKQEPAVT